MINLEQARDLLKRAMETKGPDFVYNPDAMDACHYQPVSERAKLHVLDNRKADRPNWDTGCLIGVALSIAGETRHLTVTGTVGYLRSIFPNMMTKAAEKYFDRAQQVQDDGGTWGDAFAKAERQVEEIRYLEE